MIFDREVFLERAKNIVILCNTTWNFYNFRRGVIGALIQNGMEVTCGAPRDDYVGKVSSLGCTVKHVYFAPSTFNPLREFFSFYCIIKLLVRQRPSALLTFTIKPNILGALAARILGIPVICNVAGMGAAFSSGPAKRRFAISLYRIALQRCSTVFFQNENDMQFFIEHRIVNPRAADILPGSGVNAEEYLDNSNDHSSDKTFVFLMISRLIKAKGVEEFHRAAKIISKDYGNVQFRHVGGLVNNHPDAISMRQLGEWESENVTIFVGHSDSISSELSAASCVVLPSYYPEGTPRSLLEAGASGKPIITTDKPGCRDTVIEGKTGYYCEPQNVSDLVSKMRTMLEQSPHELRAMGLESRKLIKARFDESIVVSKNLVAVDNAIGKL